MRIKLPDGREFPTHDGVTPLSWPIGTHFTLQDEREGYPRCKAVLAETSNEQLGKDRYENLKASFDPLFGHNAKRLLTLIEAEIEERKVLREKLGIPYHRLDVRPAGSEQLRRRNDNDCKDNN